MAVGYWHFICPAGQRMALSGMEPGMQLERIEALVAGRFGVPAGDRGCSALGVGSGWAIHGLRHLSFLKHRDGLPSMSSRLSRVFDELTHKSSHRPGRSAPPVRTGLAASRAGEAWRQRTLDAAQDDMLAQGGERGLLRPPPCRRIPAFASLLTTAVIWSVSLI
jgi:hypothetical protein